MAFISSRSCLISSSCLESVAFCFLASRRSWILSWRVIEAVKVPTTVEMSVATMKPFLRLEKKSVSAAVVRSPSRDFPDGFVPDLLLLLNHVGVVHVRDRWGDDAASARLSTVSEMLAKDTPRIGKSIVRKSYHGVSFKASRLPLLPRKALADDAVYAVVPRETQNVGCNLSYDGPSRDVVLVFG